MVEEELVVALTKRSDLEGGRANAHCSGRGLAWWAISVTCRCTAPYCTASPVEPLNRSGIGPWHPVLVPVHHCIVSYN